MNTLDELKQQNKQLKAERLAMRGMLEQQGLEVNMGVIQQVGERISNLMKVDSAGDYILALDKDLSTLVQHLQATISTEVKPKADIKPPTTKSQYEALSREQRTQLIRDLGQAEFSKMLYNLDE